MPFRRVRSLQELEDSLWHEPGEPALWEAVARAWDFAARTCPRRFPPGVYRHRSIEAAQSLRDEWEARDFDAFWERQHRAQLGQPDHTRI